MRIGRLATGAAAAAIFFIAAGARCNAGFYDVTPADLAGPPGSLIRVEGMDDKLSDTSVYRILYRSTGLDGKPIAVSGIVIAPDKKPPPGGWPVVAWAHGTTGVGKKCAPSLLDDPVAIIPGINELIVRNYVIAATDYPGLGTAGGHPYLVGISEGRAVLDSVRAARELTQSGAGNVFAVWGHSQGGHAALWSGELAAKYAPDLKLVGIAAAAPASELAALFEDDLDSLAGKILTGMVLSSWSQVFSAPLDAVIVPEVLPEVKTLGTDCIDMIDQGLADLRAEKKLPRKFLVADPMTVAAWKEHIVRNTPGNAHPGAPVYISQGLADTIVDPPVTVAFVAKLCKQGAPVYFETYNNVTHTRIAHASSKAAIAWIGDRFAGKPAPTNCAP